MASRKPDYRLKFLNKDTDEKGELGAAWKNEDGSISIVLNAKVTISQNEMEVLTLFTQGNKPEKAIAQPHYDPAFEDHRDPPF